jgi:hypothetical protein
LILLRKGFFGPDNKPQISKGLRMVMGARDAVEKIKPEGEIYTCPACGYTDGFHVSFKMAAGKKKAEIYLICPNCHSRFRLGWQADLSKS